MRLKEEILHLLEKKKKKKHLLNVSTGIILCRNYRSPLNTQQRCICRLAEALAEDQCEWDTFAHEGLCFQICLDKKILFKGNQHLV